MPEFECTKQKRGDSDSLHDHWNDLVYAMHECCDAQSNAYAMHSDVGMVMLRACTPPSTADHPGTADLTSNRGDSISLLQRMHNDLGSRAPACHDGVSRTACAWRTHKSMPSLSISGLSAT